MGSHQNVSQKQTFVWHNGKLIILWLKGSFLLALCFWRQQCDCKISSSHSCSWLSFYVVLSDDEKKKLRELSLFVPKRRLCYFSRSRLKPCVNCHNNVRKLWYNRGLISRCNFILCLFINKHTFLSVPIYEVDVIVICGFLLKLISFTG